MIRRIGLSVLILNVEMAELILDDSEPQFLSDTQQVTTRTRSKAGGNEKCCGINCKNNAVKNPRLHFFHFPKDEERCFIWIENAQQPDLKNKTAEDLAHSFYLCNEHFEDDMFVNAKQKQRLKPGAIPTLFEVEDKEAILQDNVKDQESITKSDVKKAKKHTSRSKEQGEDKTLSSPLVCHAMRIKPGEELRYSLESYISTHDLQGAFVVSCVGSVREARIRLADSTTIVHLTKPHEILALNGTLSGGGHLHISLSDEEGKVIGGHLVGNAVVYTTAEVIIGELPKLSFQRQMDSETSYKELVIQERLQGKKRSSGSDSDAEETASSSGGLRTPNRKRARRGNTKANTIRITSEKDAYERKAGNKNSDDPSVKLIRSENGVSTLSVNDTLLSFKHA